MEGSIGQVEEEMRVVNEGYEDMHSRTHEHGQMSQDIGGGKLCIYLHSFALSDSAALQVYCTYGRATMDSHSYIT